MKYIVRYKSKVLERWYEVEFDNYWNVERLTHSLRENEYTFEVKEIVK